MRPSAKGSTFLHLIPPWLLASLLWPPTDETSKEPNIIPHIPMEAFGWDYTLKMNVCMQFMLPDPLPLARPLPQRAPLTCPFMSTNSLLAVQTFSDSSSPPFCASPSSSFLCHQPPGERKHIVWLHLMCDGHTVRCIYMCIYIFERSNSMLTGTVWTHRFLAIVVEMSMFVFLFFPNVLTWKLEWCHVFLPRGGEQTPATLLT